MHKKRKIEVVSVFWTTHHVKAEQGPHVSVVKLQCLRKILPGQLEVFQTSLGVLYLGEIAEETER